MTTTWSLVVSLLVIGVLTSKSSGQQTLCPYGSNCTIAGYDAQLIYSMKCDRLGNLPQLPPACPNPLIVTELTIGPDSTNITRLQANLLQGLRVHKLVLRGLAIQQVDALAFSTLAADLQTLVLDDNDLTSLPDGVFSSLSSLISLQLSNNHLTTITQEVLRGLSSLVYLDLSGNNIDTIEPDTWSATPQLTILRLNNNSLSGALDAANVSGLTSLQELDLNDNAIDSVSSESLAGLGELRRFYASSNRLTSLPTNVFLANRQLEEVDVSSNNLSSLGADVFNGTKTLESLHLNNNSLDTLAVNIFRYMYNLRRLFVQDNRLSDVVSNSLTGLSSLRELNMSANMMSSLPLGMFDPLGLVTTLSLQNNVISRVDRFPFQSMKNLVALDVSKNRLGSVGADWFQATTSLVTLRLDHNVISSVEPAAFAHVPSLTELFLGSNQLSSVDGLFANCSTLRTLDLSFNPLRRLPAAGTTFAGLTALQRMNLSATCLSELSFRAATLPSLQELYLHNNSLREITSTMFSEVSTLRVLHLGANDIGTIDQTAFSQLTNLATLNLTWNMLAGDQLMTSLSQLTSEPIVDLTWNYVTSLSVVPSLPGGVYLHGNPIGCGCSVPTWLANDVTLLLDLDRTACLMTSENSSTAELVVCHLTGSCSPAVVTSPVSISCSVPPTEDTSYLLGVARPLAVCPWDVTPPSVSDINVTQNSPNSVSVRWNIVDTASVGVDAIMVIVVSGVDAQNISGLPTTGSGNGNGNTTTQVYEYGGNVTECIIDNLAAGVTYIVCVEIRPHTGQPSGDYACALIELPIEPTTAALTTVTSPAPLSIRLSTSATDSSVLVTWSLTSGSADVVQHFRLTWSSGGSDVTTVWLGKENRTYTMQNMTEATTYTVCIQAIAETGYDVTNTTQCNDVTTESRTETTPTPTPTPTDPKSSNMTIIIIAVVIGIIVLLVIIILIIVICCCRRRETKDAEAGAHPVKRQATLRANESTRSTTSENTGRLAEHSVVSMSIYEETE